MTKKVAGMQPYLFPYLGYFQLISAVDVFVLSDNLQYIERGWINRNRILLNGSAKMMTFPLKKGEYTLKINERTFTENFDADADKIIKTLRTAYSRSPYFKSVMPLLEEIIRYPERNLAKYVENSIRKLCGYLNIATPIIVASDLELGDIADKTDRVVKLAKLLGADVVINAIGGTELYDFAYFAEHGLELKFHRINNVVYRQTGDEFVPLLSIIDVMMFNEVSDIQKMLRDFSLLGPFDFSAHAGQGCNLFTRPGAMFSDAAA